MLNTRDGYSLSDIAAATKSEDGLFGGNGFWWIFILLLFFWGGNGNGFFGGGNNQAAMNGYSLSNDFSNLERDIDSVNAGLCSLNTTMLNSFNNTNTTLLNGFNCIGGQLNNMNADAAARSCATQRMLEKGFGDLNYNLASQSCEIRQNLNNNTRDIIENQNQNTSRILDFLTQDKIATLTAENQNLKFIQSQQSQNAYLVNMLSPKPVPAYVVSNPNTVVSI